MNIILLADTFKKKFCSWNIYAIILAHYLTNTYKAENVNPAIAHVTVR